MKGMEPYSLPLPPPDKDGDPRCVRSCPHDAAMRMTGTSFALRVGLNPLGKAESLPAAKT